MAIEKKRTNKKHLIEVVVPQCDLIDWIEEKIDKAISSNAQIKTEDMEIKVDLSDLEIDYDEDFLIEIAERFERVGWSATTDDGDSIIKLY